MDQTNNEASSSLNQIPGKHTETSPDYQVGIPELIPEVTPISAIPNGLNKDDIERLARKWNKQWDSASDNMRKDWEDFYKAYRQFERTTKQRISTKSNDIWAAIQTEIPHIVNSIFSKSEIVRPVPKSNSITSETELKVKNFINRMILVSSNGEARCTDAIQSFLIFGNCVGKSFWNEKPTTDIDKNQVLSDGTPNPNFMKWINSKIGEPDFINVDLFEFALDPNYSHSDITKAEWCRERIYFRKEDILMKADAGEILPVTESMLAAQGNKYRSGKEIRDSIDGRNVEDKDKQNIFVDEFWATIYFKDQDGRQQKDEFWFWMLNGEHLITFQNNEWKRKPYWLARCYRFANETWGIGEAQISVRAQNDLSAVHTQAALLAKRAGMSVTLAKPDAGLSNADSKLKEDGILILDEISEEYIRMLPTDAGKDLQILLGYKESLKKDLQETTGITDTLQGEEQGDSTATAVNISNGNSSARLAVKLQNFQSEFIQNIARHYFLLCKQFLLSPYEIRDKQSIITLTREDFQGEYDWVALGSISLSNKAVRIQQLTGLATQLSQAAMQAAQVKAAGFDLMDFVKDQVLPLFEVDDVDKYILTTNQPLGQQSPQSPSATQSSMTGVSGEPTSVTPTSAQVTTPTESALLGAANSVKTI